MGKYTHPWDFGFTPSQYIKSRGIIDPELKRALYKLGNENYEKGLEKLDSVFEYTLKCPPVRKLPSKFVYRICDKNVGGGNNGLLVASHAKPGGDFFSFDVEKAMSLYPHLSIDVIEHPSNEPDTDTNMGILILNFDNRGNQEYAEITQRLFESDVSIKAYDLIVGTLFGYPIADVVEASESSQTPTHGLEVLKHRISPDKWSKAWKEEVGMEGEEKLARIYNEVLGL